MKYVMFFIVLLSLIVVANSIYLDVTSPGEHISPNTYSSDLRFKENYNLAYRRAKEWKKDAELSSIVIIMKGGNYSDTGFFFQSREVPHNKIMNGAKFSNIEIWLGAKKKKITDEVEDYNYQESSELIDSLDINLLSPEAAISKLKSKLIDEWQDKTFELRWDGNPKEKYLWNFIETNLIKGKEPIRLKLNSQTGDIEP